MTVGEKLRTLRVAKGLSTAAIDDYFSLTRGTMVSWECGFREPEEELVEEIIRYLGKEPSIFMNIEENRDSSRELSRK